MPPKSPKRSRRKVDNTTEQNYRSLVENVQDYAIFMLDKEGCVESWDQGARRLFKYTSNQVMGKHFSLFFTPSDKKKKLPAKDLKSALKNGKSIDEREYRRKDGTHFWSAGVLTSTIDDSGTHQGFSKIMRDITEQKDLQRTILHRSTHDYLTGLPNRGFFEELLIKSIREERKEYLLSLFFLDFNNFKLINDEEGHRIGDHILVEIASRLTKNTRKSDVAARLGGDEFVMLLRSFSNVKDIERFAQKILNAFKKPIKAGGKEIKTSVSIGVSIYPNDGEKAGDLLHNADMALYQSKKKGGNQFNLYKDIKFLKKDFGKSHDTKK